MSKRQRNKARQFAESAPSIPAVNDYPDPTPEAYEGAGMEDLDAALEQPAPTPAAEPIDLSDPDAKAAWLDLLADAFIEGDQEKIKKLQAMIPDPQPQA